MSVGVQREACRKMPQHARYGFDVHAVLERHRREGVTQVMEAPASGGTAFDRYVRLAAAPVGVQIFLQRLLYWLRSSG